MCAAVTDDARKKANIRLLQRTVDRSITDILATATHVVLYEFANASWSKSEVDGSLFVVAKGPHTSAAEVTYMLAILNRSSNDNFTMPIASDLHMQHQEPYLICKRILFDEKSGSNQSIIQGIWFHHDHERLALTQTLQEIIQSLQQNQPLPLNSSNNKPQQQLVSSTSAFTSKSEGAMSISPQLAQQQTQPLAATGVSSSSSARHTTPIAATLAAAHYNHHQQEQTLMPQHQQHHQSEQSSQYISSSHPTTESLSGNFTGLSLFPSSSLTSAATPDERAQLAALLSQTASMAYPQPPAATDSRSLQQNQSAAPSSNFTATTTTTTITTSTYGGGGGSGGSGASMSTATSSSATSPRAAQSQATITVAPPPPPTPATTAATGEENNATTATAAASLPPGAALDKRSLQLALLSLIQDDRFLDLLHSQYLRVMKARSKKGGDES
ncbi:hypothetical protein ACA910_007772 [Epithemia clementina (nom. ined.)]